MPSRTTTAPQRSNLWSPCACRLIEVVRAVVWETADGRQRVHVAQGAGDCDAGVSVGQQVLLEDGKVRGTSGPTCSPACEGPSAPGWPGHLGVALRLTGHCGCLGYLTDAVSAALVYLDGRGAAVTDPAAAARRHVRSRQHDHIRAERVAQGAQARTDRIEDGIIGRALGTREQRWVLRDIAEEAGSTAPLEDDAQLLRRLVLRRSRRTGEDIAALERAVADDVAAVRAVARRVGRRVDVGRPGQPELVSWWDAYIERPLGRRRRHSTRPWDEQSDGRQLCCGPLQQPDDPIGDALRAAVHGVPSSVACDAALVHLLEQLVQRGILSAAAARAVLADPRRRAHAERAFGALRAHRSAASGLAE